MAVQHSPDKYSLLFVLSLSFVINFAFISDSRAEHKDSYTLGVLPYLPPSELEKIFAPIAADLSKVAGKKIILRTSTSYKKFSQSIQKHKFDFVFLQPFDYVQAADQYGYRPLASRKGKLKVIFASLENSKINNVAEFSGKHIALPPASAAVSILTKHHLKSHGLIPGKNVYLSHHRSHISCMQKLTVSEADICATVAPAFALFEKKMKLKLKVVDSSVVIPFPLFAVNPDVNQKVRQQVQERILSWNNHEEGKRILERGKFRGFFKVQNSDYDVVRNLTHK